MSPRPATPSTNQPSIVTARAPRRRNGTSSGIADSIDAAARVNGSTISPVKTEVDPIEILLVDDTPDKLLALEAALSDMGENLVRDRKSVV